MIITFQGDIRLFECYEATRAPQVIELDQWLVNDHLLYFNVTGSQVAALV